jgi:hypothetical protein
LTNAFPWSKLVDFEERFYGIERSYNVSKQGIRDVGHLNILEYLGFFLVAATQPNWSEQGTEVGGAERGRAIGYLSYITSSLLVGRGQKTKTLPDFAPLSTHSS